ncbi:hypothetical protein EVAR_8454_1 [Eumeta japonica]|uniref:Uncharacterized protein n=1 Tax=Eumeta variegata TaxID=151549 RepID=A0A4C1WFE5_EUMVA|nr:hypothetical protein EVAR_8454_1 [Eumeta japonica]
MDEPARAAPAAAPPALPASKGWPAPAPGSLEIYDMRPGYVRKYENGIRIASGIGDEIESGTGIYIKRGAGVGNENDTTPIDNGKVSKSCHARSGAGDAKCTNCVKEHVTATKKHLCILIKKGLRGRVVNPFFRDPGRQWSRPARADPALN